MGQIKTHNETRALLHTLRCDSANGAGVESFLGGQSGCGDGACSRVPRGTTAEAGGRWWGSCAARAVRRPRLHNGSRVPRTELDAHSDALVTATSRKSCSYTSPERGENRRAAAIHNRPPSARTARATPVAYIYCCLFRREETHYASGENRCKKMQPRAQHLRRKLAPHHTHTHTRSAGTTNSGDVRRRRGTYLHASCVSAGTSRTLYTQGNRWEKRRLLFQP